MTDPLVPDNRLRRFASFFKGYMGVMPVVTAAVAPILTMMKAIPVFESQKTMLATYSGLLGFLLLAWVFYARRSFIRNMIPKPPTNDFAYVEEKFRLFFVNVLPLILIASSVMCFMFYQYTLEAAIGHAESQVNAVNSQTVAASQILKIGNGTRQAYLENWGQLHPIYGAVDLQAFYLGIFLFAELAFVLMALREYGYGVLNISEEEVLRGKAVSCAPE
jgi:hypothetical protein